jgi:hypothetical protein
VNLIYLGWDLASYCGRFPPLNAVLPFSFMPRPKAATVMTRVELSVNSELLDLFDSWWRSNHFPTRNEALRQILREKVDCNGAPTAVN